MIDDNLILLNTKEAIEYVKTDWYFAGEPASWIALIITTILVIVGVISIIAGIRVYDEEEIGFGTVMIVIAIIITICTLIHEVNKTYPQYQVTITEKTNMKEFYEKYEVINHDGLIFTIRDKDYMDHDYS